MVFDWLILGGGIHGVHIAARLIGDAGVPQESLRIVDPAPRLLARWRACTETTGMTHLRSPAVHHIDLGALSLKRFGKQRKCVDSDVFKPPYDRPALSLFNAHCDEVVQTFGLAGLHVQDRASGCSLDCDVVRVQLSSGRELEARQLVLAIGASEQPLWPEWAPRRHERVQHVFEPSFDGWPSSPETVLVVGGGISASQVALRLVGEGHEVEIISPHALRPHHFDSDPGWLGPKFMAGFGRERNLDRRRALISEARHKGSVSPDVQRALHRALNRNELCWHEDTVVSLQASEQRLEIQLRSGMLLEADRVLLATGFAERRPGGAMVDELIESASLPCAGCGYPIVDAALRWHPRIYVTGPLAELELGPAARNIAGARRAADRLVGALRTGETAP